MVLILTAVSPAIMASTNQHSSDKVHTQKQFNLKTKEWLKRHTFQKSSTSPLMKDEDTNKLHFLSVACDYMVDNFIPYWRSMKWADRVNFQQFRKEAFVYDKELIDIIKLGFQQVRTQGFVYGKELIDIKKLGRETLGEKDDDVIKTTWLGHMLYMGGHLSEAQSLLETAYPKLQDSRYSRIQSFFCARSIAHILSCLKPYADKEIKRWKRKALKDFGLSISAGEFSREESNIAHYLIRLTSHKPFDDTKWKLIYSFIESSSEIDPWIKLVFKGEAEISAAWEARGSGYAGTVTDEGWSRYETHLNRAGKLLRQAWKQRPELPEAASGMSIVSRTRAAVAGETPRLWFDRAIAAQIDYKPVYDSMMTALLPRWGGSHDAMMEFARQCLKTRRFDTDIPIYYLMILRRVAYEMPGSLWRYPFRIKQNNEELNDLFSGLLTDESRIDQHCKILTQWALCEAWGGNYDKARTLLKKAKCDVSLLYGFWDRPLSWDGRSKDEIDAEMNAFLGPNKEDLEKAESLIYSKRANQVLSSKKSIFNELIDSENIDKLMNKFLPGHSDGKMKEGVNILETVMKKSRPDGATYRYLRDRIASYRMGFSAEEGKDGVLHTAARWGNAEVLQYLISHHAGINLKNHFDKTALHYAIRYHQGEAAKILIESGADLNATNFRKWTPLHLAIKLDQPNVAEELIQKGANVNSLTDWQWSPLNLSLYNSQSDIALLLIEHGADLNSVTRAFWTPLHYALRYDQPHIAKVLIEKGANVNQSTPEMWAPIHYALYYGHIEIASLLIDKDASINLSNKQSWTPLHYATSSGYSGIAIRLIELGADVNARNNRGWTPLHLASYYGSADVVNKLISAGANVTSKLPDGRQPVDIARAESRLHLVDILSKRQK
jgi:ankyrin repeat protein